MAAATENDYSLGEFISDFPATWNGFVQLRMYLGAANAPQYSQSYPALNLQVVGNTWHTVGGASVDCSSGTSISIESIVLPTTTTTAPATATTTTGHSSTTTHHATTTTSRSSTGATTGSTSGSGYGVVIGVIAAIVVLAGIGGLLARRRLKARSKPPGPA
jgi:hypothetical protein